MALLLVPVSVVEPLKLIAVAVAGEGHWIAGTAMVAGAYAVSVLFIERLFRLGCLGLPGYGAALSASAASSRVGLCRRWPLRPRLQRISRS